MSSITNSVEFSLFFARLIVLKSPSPKNILLFKLGIALSDMSKCFSLLMLPMLLNCLVLGNFQRHTDVSGMVDNPATVDSALCILID